MTEHQCNAFQRYENACVCGSRHRYCVDCGKGDNCIEREMWLDLLRDYAEFKRTGSWPS